MYIEIGIYIYIICINSPISSLPLFEEQAVLMQPVCLAHAAVQPIVVQQQHPQGLVF